MGNEIRDARAVMREAFERDRDFKESYIANVAVILMDEFGIGYQRRCEVAEKIIDRIFSK